MNRAADLFAYAERYPSAPGYKDRDTSRLAAESMAKGAPLLREQCRRALRDGPATADEIAGRLGQSILSIRPRLSELKQSGEVVDTGERRPNASGRPAKVLRLT